VGVLMAGRDSATDNHAPTTNTPVRWQPDPTLRHIGLRTKKQTHKVRFTLHHVLNHTVTWSGC